MQIIGNKQKSIHEFMELKHNLYGYNAELKTTVALKNRQAVK